MSDLKFERFTWAPGHEGVVPDERRRNPDEKTESGTTPGDGGTPRGGEGDPFPIPDELRYGHVITNAANGSSVPIDERPTRDFPKIAGLSIEEEPAETES